MIALSGCIMLVEVMMTSPNGNIFQATGTLWGESIGHRWIPLTKASDAELWYLFNVCLNKCLSKQTRCRRLETPWCSLWRHSNVNHAADGRIIGILLWYDVASETGPLLVNRTAWIPNGALHCVYTRLKIINIATRVWAVLLLQTL